MNDREIRNTIMMWFMRCHEEGQCDCFADELHGYIDDACYDRIDDIEMDNEDEEGDD